MNFKVKVFYAFRAAHTPDNTFLGFVVQPHFSAQENKQLNSIVRKKQALVYGKRASFWQVGLCCKYLFRQAAKEVCGKTISTSFTPYFFFIALSLLSPAKAFCPPVQRSNFTLLFVPSRVKRTIWMSSTSTLISTARSTKAANSRAMSQTTALSRAARSTAC